MRWYAVSDREANLVVKVAPALSWIANVDGPPNCRLANQRQRQIHVVDLNQVSFLRHASRVIKLDGAREPPYPGEQSRLDYLLQMARSHTCLNFVLPATCEQTSGSKHPAPSHMLHNVYVFKSAQSKYCSWSCPSDESVGHTDHCCSMPSAQH